MLEEITQQAKAKLAKIEQINAWQEAKIEFLGKSSQLSQEMRNIGQAEIGRRKELGQKINLVRQEVEILFLEKKKLLDAKLMKEKFEQERLDLTIPARPKKIGSIHPITQCLEEMIQLFAKYGFDIKDGPDIENDWYNFTALNIAENHPARQMHDTFYLHSEQGDDNAEIKLLRTHTSPIQIRTMQQEKPPYRFIAPGRTYRSDSDQTHTPMFHQIEGMVIDEAVHMGHLKYIITDFIKNFFEQPAIQIRFRPSFFPFTEPSAEVDVKMRDSDQWLEVLGAGMVHPVVLENVGLDAKKYQGFAFGLGVERFAMLKYGIKDLRQFFEGDIRWQEHYNFSALDIPNLAGGLTR